MIGGGTFIEGIYDKKIPGSYFVVKTNKDNTQVSPLTGVVAVPLSLEWGPENAVVEMTVEQYLNDSLKFTGYTTSEMSGIDGDVRFIPEIFAGGASKIYLYRLNSGGTKAKTTAESSTGVIAEAKYTGLIGNELSTACLEIIDNENSLEVQTLLRGNVVDKQIVSATIQDGVLTASWDEVKDNDFITWLRSGTSLTPHEATPLTGGLSGASTGAQAAAFRTAIQSKVFNVLCLCGSDFTDAESVSELNTFVTWTNMMADSYGVRFQTVYAGVTDTFKPNADRAIVVRNAPKTEDGGDGTNGHYVAWVSGLSASTLPGKTMTNKTYTGNFSGTADYVKDMTPALTEKYLDEGYLLLHHVGDDIRILSDINSFTGPYTDVHNSEFAYNGTIRLGDYFASGISEIFNSQFLGIVPNDQAGRDALKAKIYEFGATVQTSLRAIEGWSADSITVTPIDKRSVNANIRIVQVGNMEISYNIVLIE